MILKKIYLVLLTFFLVFPLSAYSQVTMAGGKGLLRVFEAETVYPGHFYFNPFYNGYFTETVAGKSNEDHTMNLGLTLGLTNAFEVFAHLVPYQDDQTHIWGPIGDTQWGVKFHVPAKGATIQNGLLAFATFPTGVNHNLPYEPFSVDANGWGLMWLTTFDFRKGTGTLPLKLSLNLGYRDMDWSDRYFSDKKDQLLAGLGVKFPIRSSILYTELTGEIFINNPDQVQFSQNLFRVTQGIRFLGPWHLVCDIAADLGLGGDNSEDINKIINPYVKNYADWKVIVGVTYRTTLFRHLTREEKIQRKKQREEENKLDTIRKKREKVVKDLEEMKKKLEKEKKIDEPR